MSDSVLQTVPLGTQWPTVDPFLFCAHHDDAYPAGDASNGPAASLAGRQLGQDFAGVDGWNMYHGRKIPGFPQHPHRGFETITFVRRGIIDHSDSLGATARFGRGDVQWMTAGAGIVHAEMFPLLHTDQPNPMQMFQVWLNLPAEDKMVEPYFTMLWEDDIPKLTVADDQGLTTTVTMPAGAFGTDPAPNPPPNSWAARADSDVAIWHIHMEAGASWQLPAATGPDTVRTLYLFEGSQVSVDGVVVGSSTGAAVDPQRPLTLQAGDTEIEILMLQGRPIGQPVAQHGPFVMNTHDELEQTFRDYQETAFGGWPWPSDDPVHRQATNRFAKHGDGRIEESLPI